MAGTSANSVLVWLALSIGMRECVGADAMRGVSTTLPTGTTTVCVGHYLLGLPATSSAKVEATLATGNHGGGICAY